MRDARNDDSRPEDDQAAIDRAFAELVADFHRTPDAPPRPTTSGQPVADQPHPGGSDPELTEDAQSEAGRAAADDPDDPAAKDPDPYDRDLFDPELFDPDQFGPDPPSSTGSIDSGKSSGDPNDGDGLSWPRERRSDPTARPPFEFRLDLDAPADPEPEPPEERYIPPPAPPLPRPTAPVFVGWLGIVYAIVVMLLIAFRVPLPQWVGWIAIGAFFSGLALLLSRLPRHRPPDDDDGARL